MGQSDVLCVFELNARMKWHKKGNLMPDAWCPMLGATYESEHI